MFSSSTSLCLFLTAFACFAAFAWAMKSHFRRTGPLPAGCILIAVLSLLGFGSFSARLALGGPAGLWEFALLLFGLSLALFVWTVETTRRTPPTLAFDDDKPSFLLREGPYRYVRHPFYLSYILFWAGTAVAFQGWLPWVFPVVMVMVYRHAAAREEQKFAHSELAAAYASYQARAGMFLPRVAITLSVAG